MALYSDRMRKDQKQKTNVTECSAICKIHKRRRKIRVVCVDDDFI